MKFLVSLKNQIIESVRATNCCLYSFLSGLIISGAAKIEKNLIELPYFDNTTFFFLTHKFDELYGGRISPERVTFAGSELMLISGEGLNELYENLGYNVINCKYSLNERIFENECCKKAFLKGCFIGCGRFYFSEDSAVKSRGYNLEFVFDDAKMFKVADKLFTGFKIKMKSSKRQKRYILYSKNSEQIGDIITLLDAVKAYLDFQNELALRSVKNNINRQNNCFDANQNKTINASFEILSILEKIRKTAGLGSLPPTLREAANLRLNFPDASLSELCKKYSIPITRAGMKYKFDAIKKFSEKGV